MARGDAREGKWRGNRRMEGVASTLHTTSEHGVSIITTADAHTSADSSRLNWRPRRFKWTRPFRRKTKSGFCSCAITFQTQSTKVKALNPGKNIGDNDKKGAPLLLFLRRLRHNTGQVSAGDARENNLSVYRQCKALRTNPDQQNIQKWRKSTILILSALLHYDPLRRFAVYFDRGVHVSGGSNSLHIQ
jgi:hypothetical protein